MSSSRVTQRIARLIAVVQVALACLAANALADETRPVASLAPGEHVFWDGPYVDQATVGAGDMCGIAGPCWTYALVVEPGEARRLRVAIDWPSSENMYELDLFDPSGKLVGTMSGYGSWSDELFAANPAPGTWKVRVVPENVTASAFRARAKLEAPPKPAATKKKATRKRATCRSKSRSRRSKRRARKCKRKTRRRAARSPAAARDVVLPNLQVNAPWDPTLVGPAAVGPTALVIHRPLDVLGYHPLSCSADEMLLNGVEKCLRFSVGPMNISPGRFELEMELSEARPNSGGHLEGPVTQRLYRADGTYTTRDAGTFVAHEQHMHFHVQDLLEYTLFRVVDRRRGRIEPTGVGNKASFCTLDLMIPFFDDFTTEGPKFRGASPCAVPPEGDTKLVMGISPGWADVYTWDLPDQYIDFGAGGQGLFLIRAQVDGKNTVLESDENDNYGYALVELSGDEFEVLERGIGQSPWDPRKQVLPLEP